jgi:hypothetical protein
MPAAKLVVIYPVPTDLEKFERLYLEQHVPMAVDRLAGKTKIVATKCLVRRKVAPHRSIGLQRSISLRCRPYRRARF